MNLKLYLGVFLPLIVIIILTSLSISNIGFTVEETTVETVEFNSLFAELRAGPTTTVRTITLTNNFFLPRKYEIPSLLACLHDKDGVASTFDLSVGYSESSTNPTIPDPAGLSHYSVRSREYIDVPANSEKQVILFIEPKYLNNYDISITSYNEHDEVLLVELSDTDDYRYCRYLESDELLEKSTSITII